MAWEYRLHFGVAPEVVDLLDQRDLLEQQHQLLLWDSILTVCYGFDQTNLAVGSENGWMMFVQHLEKET